MMQQLSITDIQRFEAGYEVGSSDQCWVWNAGRDANGYGRTSASKKNLRAHRVAFFLFYGFIADYLCVCHRCDNPPCVNPGHLFLGTDLDNSKDRDRKGRQARGAKIGEPLRLTTPRGEDRYGAKLRTEDVAQIKSLLQAGATNTEISKQFGVTNVTVSLIKRGKLWTHVLPDETQMNHRNEKIASLVQRLEPAYTITCSECKDDGVILNPQSIWDAARQLHEKGWRLKAALLCPQCVENAS